MSTAPPPVNRSSSTGETGLAGGWVAMLVIHLHGMGLAFGWRGSGDCVVALTEGVSSVSGAIAISDSVASPAPWSDESSSWVAVSPGWPRPRLDWWWEIATLRFSMSFLLRSISLLSLFQADASDSARQASMRSSSSPQICVRHPWSSASELSSPVLVFVQDPINNLREGEAAYHWS